MKKEKITDENPPIKITNVIENFKLIRLFLLIVGVAFIVMIVSFSYVYLHQQKYNIEHLLKINTKGEIVPMEVVKIRDLYEIEAKDHIKTFVELFFDYDQFNYQKKTRNSP